MEALGPEFNEIMTLMSPLFAILGVVYGLLFLITIVSYILRGLAILNMSKQRGLENGWLGFIPFARDWQLGKIAHEIEIGNKKITNPGLWLVLAPIIYGTVFGIGYAALMVPYFISIFSLAETAAPEAIIGPVTSLIIGMFFFIFVMIIAQVFLYLIVYLSFHKIFSQYEKGQKPVFYLILAMFVPLATPIILYMLSKRPLLPHAAAEFAPVAAYPAEATSVYAPAPVSEVAAPVEVAEAAVPVDAVADETEALSAEQAAEYN